MSVSFISCSDLHSTMCTFRKECSARTGKDQHETLGDEFLLIAPNVATNRKFERQAIPKAGPRKVARMDAKFGISTSRVKTAVLGVIAWIERLRNASPGTYFSTRLHACNR